MVVNRRAEDTVDARKQIFPALHCASVMENVMIKVIIVIINLIDRPNVIGIT